MAPSTLASMLAAELAAQRVFLSAEEEAALARPLSYDAEEDLAWERLKGRRQWFFPVLRDRYIKDHRPAENWQALIAAEETAAGEQTIITQLARQVLRWSALTSDRGAMMAGFVARALRWLGLLLIALGAYGWFNGAPVAGPIVAITGAALYLSGRTAARYAARRASAVAAEAGV